MGQHTVHQVIEGTRRFDVKLLRKFPLVSTVSIGDGGAAGTSGACRFGPSGEDFLNFENQCQCSAVAIGGPKREKEELRGTSRFVMKGERTKAAKPAY